MSALLSPPNPITVDKLSPDKRKEPYPFRPSSSRMELLLSGIGFNIHVQNLSLFSVESDESTSSGTGTCVPVALFQNVTCGAPADHFRGFGPKGVEGKTASGGLRRLEAARVAAAQSLRNIQDSLIASVGQYFQSQQQTAKTGGRSRRHVPATNVRISRLRKAAIDETEYLYALSWEIALRRGNTFSQALGIAITLYLTLISDVVRMQTGGWAALWKQYGFLITFEGLLSTAGKELGMIEDASVAIAMLRMVSVVLVPEADQGATSSSRVSVPDCPYVRWVDVLPSGSGSAQKYRVEIGIDSQYYFHKVPPQLRDGAAVQFYPILFQMGVDIRQWGANARMRVKATVAPSYTSSSSAENLEDKVSFEDDDDEIGFADNDVLVALNYEALRKMNAYAHIIAPISTNMTLITWEQAYNDQQLQQPVHTMLSKLYDVVRNSAGKMEHGVMDRAATAAAKLGGGGAVFCKSGKDRTAMQVTFKQAQFVNRFLTSGCATDGYCDEREISLSMYLRMRR